MGKGDKKTARGKRFAGSFGKTRQKTQKTPNPSRMAALRPAIKEVAETTETAAPAKKTAAKKPAAKKTTAKKTTATTKKATAAKKPAAKKSTTKKVEETKED